MKIFLFWSHTYCIKFTIRRFLSDYVAKLDNKKTIPALAWLERRGEGREKDQAEEDFTPVKLVNRNSVEEEEEESDTETDNESSLVAAADANQSWPDSEEELEDANIDFEDFSGTDTEDEEGEFELSDTEEEDEEEERDKFEELAIPPDRRASTVSQIPMYPIEQGEPSKLVEEAEKSVTEKENEEKTAVKQEEGGFESGLVEVKPGGGLIRQGPMGEPFVPLVQREVKLQHSQSMCGIR